MTFISFEVSICRRFDCVASIKLNSSLKRWQGLIGFVDMHQDLRQLKVSFRQLRIKRDRLLRVVLNLCQLASGVSRPTRCEERARGFLRSVLSSIPRGV